eukprot:SAG11_NODE_34847_length_269_cov_4.282353_1_plen_45_part_10
MLERVKFLHDLHIVARELVHDANMKMAYYANLRKQDIDNFPIGTS